jgi:hypothetical protein
MCIFAAGVAYARNHFHFVQIRFSVSVSAYSIPIDGSITSQQMLSNDGKVIIVGSVFLQEWLVATEDGEFVSYYLEKYPMLVLVQLSIPTHFDMMAY